MSRIRKAKQDVAHVRIEELQADRRIDNFLLGRFEDVPRSRVYQMIRRGEVRVNGGRVSPHYRLQTGDDVRLPPVAMDAGSRPPAVPAALGSQWKNWILYEDEDLLVAGKPSGLAVHGGSGIAFGIIDVLRRFHPAGDSLQLAHRLDRETSGCLMIGRHAVALRHIQELLREGHVQKHYLALLQGRLRPGELLVDAALDREGRRAGERHVRVTAQGKAAATRFKTVRHIGNATLATAAITTGRTHQIRVHAAHVGHAVAGDDRYGDRAFNRELKKAGLRRLFLHASRLRIARPGGSILRVEAPLPEDLRRFLDAFERASAR